MSLILKRVAFSTLGCRLNQYETDALVTTFKRAGYDVVPWTEPADVYIINTCTVTDRSDRKSRQLVYQAGRAAAKPIIVVTGCYADHQKAELQGRKDITLVVDNDRKAHIFGIIDSHFRGEIIDPDSLKADRFSFGDARDGFHTRSSIKIQDGCDNFCTFCIIPHVRGRAIGRPIDEILNQAREMIDLGAKEIVVTGVNIGRYECDGVSFTRLMESLLDMPGDFRVRVSSIEPDTWGHDFIPLLEHPKLCPHLHLCLQSGSEKMLLKMRRQYTIAEYLDFIRVVLKRQPDFNFTTDIMVGFPEETEEDFQQTCNVAREVGFSHIHTFPYSKRQGTRAARSADQIPQSVKTERARIVREISDNNKLEYRRGIIGKNQIALVEGIQKGIARGYGQHYVPVLFPAEPDTIIGAFAEVRVESLSQDGDPQLRASVLRL